MKVMRPPERFHGKVVLVTGVGAGVGLATAVRFGCEGGRVVAAARSDEHVELARATFEAQGIDGRAVHADVATEAGAARCVETAVREFGALDVLANTAGGYEGGSFDTVDLAMFERMIDSNLRTVFCTARAAVPELEKRGGGAIVVTTAVFGAVVPGPGLLAYNTSKAAATALVQNLAGDLAPRNIRVNAVLPGAITHRYDADAPAGPRRLQQGPALPQEVAAAVVFLASDEAAWITGASLVVDGGFAIGRKAF